MKFTFDEWLTVTFLFIFATYGVVSACQDLFRWFYKARDAAGVKND